MAFPASPQLSPFTEPLSEVTNITVPSIGETSNMIRFTTIKALLEEINSIGGDLLKVNGVSEQDFELIKDTREKCIRKFRFRLYTPKSKQLIISIPTPAHETLHTLLYEEVLSAIWGMNLKRNWKSMAATAFTGQNNPLPTKGEGDSTGGPRPERRKPNDWPTLVIEAGYSSTLALLRTKMRWWFSTSDHAVKIVVLVKLNQQGGTIIIEKWDEDTLAPRQGATTTRLFAAAVTRIEPIRKQVIVITRAPGVVSTDPDYLLPQSYSVFSGALRLEFHLLFLRQPRQDLGEMDIIVNIQELQAYAVEVWEMAPA